MKLEKFGKFLHLLLQLKSSLSLIAVRVYAAGMTLILDHRKRVHRFCCRFPADREQVRPHALRAEAWICE
ncbi:hypothetical protein K0038_01526 [Pseudomonas syringae]|uniref:hypothetical protein n=1 Tax=Pseudomonas syringae TaxID=317 RepID=UPI001CA88DD5|nr:hypothetical protein [Pseudomonas syringae]MCI3944511.1 hypothetical protein [Pseudomonas syringae]